MKSNIDSTLKNKYGHEENISKAIANSKSKTRTFLSSIQ